MPDLLLEIGTEELPAGFQQPAVRFLEQALPEALAELRLDHGDVKADATPRRLVLRCERVAERQTDKEEEVTGPKADIAWGADGKLSKAGQGFLRGRGLDESAAYKKETKKGVVMAALAKEEGQPAGAVLGPTLEKLIGRIPFQKRMRYSDEKVSFGRPPRWLLCLLGGEVLPVSFGGLKSGRVTHGHRFHAPEARGVGSLDEYFHALGEGKVMLSAAARREEIATGAQLLAEQAGGRLVEDEALLDEVAGLVERPWPLLGRFEERFLEIPREILLSEMREHQKYFAVEDEGGKLLPAFVVVAGSEPPDPADVAAGHGRVLRSRFEDGAFYYREDTKVPLSELAGRLQSVLFQRALGSLADKVARVRRLTEHLADQVGASADDKAAALRAAELCKADLVSGVVGEFPALQGTMGRYYAQASGEPDAVAAAIEEHYAPRTAHDQLPASLPGALVAVTDRLDTLVGILGVLKAPTGSADPFGLRRAAIAVLHVAIERGWRCSVAELIGFAVAGVEDRLQKKSAAELQEQVLEFLSTRLKGVLADRVKAEGLGEAGDIVDAARDAGYDDLTDLDERTRALARMRSKDKDGFLSLAATFKRVGNILAKARTDGLPTDPAGLDPAKLTEPAERELLAAVDQAKASFDERATTGSYDDALETLASLKPAVDKFFDDVLVMADDEAVRDARLALLARLEQMLVRLAAFTRIQVEA